MRSWAGRAYERTFRCAMGALTLLLCAGLLSAQYVGSTACKECHPVQYQKQSSSPHAKALATARPGAPGEWAFGAGQKAITYLSYQSEDWYLERGLSFYAASKRMAPTPGHQGAVDLPYPTLAAGASVARCFRCHSTGTLRLSSTGAIEPAENGVGCESCHGPGAEHVRSADPAKIGNPKRLNAVEMNRFCGTCHRRPPEPAEVNDGRVAIGLKFDWSNRWNVRQQPAYLSQSACFRASGGELSCITCHDPHTAANPSAASYDQRCASCHTDVKHLAPTPGVACVSCHMPNVSATSEMQFTNHWIGVYSSANPLVPAHSPGTRPPLDLPPTEAGKHQPPNDVAGMRPLFEQAIAAEEERPGSPQLAHRLETLGLFLKETGNPSAAELPLRRAVQLNRDRHAAETASSEIELAQILQTLGRSQDAIALFQQAAGEADARASAQAYESLARLDVANRAAYYAKAVAAEETAWGKSNPRVATQLSNLALASRAGRESTASETLLRRALDIQVAAFGRNHYQTAATINNLASVLQDLGKLAEAENLWREALSIFRQKLPNSPEIAAVSANLADVLNRKGDKPGAIALLREAIANDEAAGGADTVEAAADLAGLAHLLQQSGDQTGAEPLLRRALSIYEARLGSESFPARETKLMLEGTRR